MANAYSDRVSNRADNLELAIQHLQQALEVLTRQARPLEWATTTMNLANVYHSRIYGVRADNLDLAIQYYKQALEVLTSQEMPFEWAETRLNLARVYADRIHGSHADNLECAIQYYKQALEIFQIQTQPAEYRQVQRNLSRIYFEKRQWSAAQTTAHAALAAGNLLYQAAATAEARQAELRETQGVPSLAAYAALRAAGDQPAGETAVLVLEQNRARWLSESLSLQEEKPATTPETVWQTFTALRAALQELEAELRLPENTPGQRDYLTLSQLMGTARQQLAEQIDLLREYAPDFMPTLTFAEIRAVATVTPLVYLVVTSAGGVALLIQGETITPVWLDTVAEDTLHEALIGYLVAYLDWRNNRNAAARDAWFQALEAMMDWLGETIMQPVSTALRAQGVARAVLIPTDNLGLLPLHAAIETPGRDVSTLVYTYAPNARALNAAQQVASGSPPTSLLAIDNPDGSLHFSGEEVAAALETFPTEKHLHLANQAAAPEAVRAALTDYTVWHFSTHGRAGWDVPLEGSLLLAGKTPLTLRDLLSLKATARLAVLSACETGIPGVSLPDEVISLPTGLLQAGVAGVVSSLWSVNDFSTALLMMRFYQAWRVEGQEPPVALHTARTWLRTSTRADLEGYVKESLPEYGNVTRLPRDAANNLYRALKLVDCQPNEYPFAHPFYWAGFYYTGV